MLLLLLFEPLISLTEAIEVLCSDLVGEVGCWMSVEGSKRNDGSKAWYGFDGSYGFSCFCFSSVVGLLGQFGVYVHVVSSWSLRRVVSGLPLV